MSLSQSVFGRKRPLSPSSDIPGSQPKKRVVKWHPLHCDPILDVVLVSLDGIHFRASSHALKRESSMFADMLSSIPNQYQSETDAIPLEYSSAAITFFLDTYSTASPPYYGDLLFSLLFEILGMVTHLDCDRFIQTATNAYYNACVDNPVLWLAATSKDNNWEGAKAALRQCRKIDVPLNADTYFQIVSQLRVSWQFPLFQRLAEPGDNKSNTNRLVLFWPSDGEGMDFLMADLRKVIAKDAKERESVT